MGQQQNKVVRGFLSHILDRIQRTWLAPQQRLDGRLAGQTAGAAVPTQPRPLPGTPPGAGHWPPAQRKADGGLSPSERVPARRGQGRPRPPPRSLCLKFHPAQQISCVLGPRGTPGPAGRAAAQNRAPAGTGRAQGGHRLGTQTPTPVALRLQDCGCCVGTGGRAGRWQGAGFPGAAPRAEEAVAGASHKVTQQHRGLQGLSPEDGGAIITQTETPGRHGDLVGPRDVRERGGDTMAARGPERARTDPTVGLLPPPWVTVTPTLQAAPGSCEAKGRSRGGALPAVGPVGAGAPVGTPLPEPRAPAPHDSLGLTQDTPHGQRAPVPPSLSRPSRPLSSPPPLSCAGTP